MCAVALLLLLAASGTTGWEHTYPDGTTLKVSSVATGIVRVKTVPRGAREDFTAVDLTLRQPQPPPPPLGQRGLVAFRPLAKRRSP